MAIVFVTHDVDEAVLLSQRIVLLAATGRIDEIISVDLPEPRWQHDPRGNKDFAAIRGHIWDRIRGMQRMARRSRNWPAPSPRSGGKRIGIPIAAIGRGPRDGRACATRVCIGVLRARALRPAGVITWTAKISHP